VYSEDKIYMPVPQKFARGDEMGRGPYEKSGIIADTGLHPGKTHHEHLEILFPYQDVEVDGRQQRQVTSEELNVKVELWYLPYGNKNTDPFLWKEFEETVRVGKVSN
jgi:hypothetical protein